MDTEALIIYTMVAAGGIFLAAGLVQEFLSETGNERCEVCGYLLDGPLHEEKRCEARKKVRRLSPSEIETRRIHHINEDVFGF